MDQELFQFFVHSSRKLSRKLTSHIEAYGPIILQRRWDQPLLTVLARCITGQLLSVAAARSIWKRVEDKRGDQPFDQFLDRISSAELRALGLSGAKVKTFKAVSVASKAGQLNEQELSTLSSGERRDILMQIKGVGEWTADMMEIFYFLEKDIWPPGDVAVQRTLTALTDKRRNNILTADRFRPYRSYLALYMWAFVNAQSDQSGSSSLL